MKIDIFGEGGGKAALCVKTHFILLRKPEEWSERTDIIETWSHRAVALAFVPFRSLCANLSGLLGQQLLLSPTEVHSLAWVGLLNVVKQRDDSATSTYTVKADTSLEPDGKLDLCPSDVYLVFDGRAQRGQGALAPSQ